jgi:hypothetical protein
MKMLNLDKWKSGFEHRTSHIDVIYYFLVHREWYWFIKWRTCLSAHIFYHRNYFDKILFWRFALADIFSDLISGSVGQYLPVTSFRSLSNSLQKLSLQLHTCSHKWWLLIPCTVQLMNITSCDQAIPWINQAIASQCKSSLPHGQSSTKPWNRMESLDHAFPALGKARQQPVPPMVNTVHGKTSPCPTQSMAKPVRVHCSP